MAGAVLGSTVPGSRGQSATLKEQLCPIWLSVTWVGGTGRGAVPQPEPSDQLPSAGRGNQRAAHSGSHPSGILLSGQAVQVVQATSEPGVPTRHLPAHRAAHCAVPTPGSL